MSIATDKVNSFEFEDTIKTAGFSIAQVLGKVQKDLYFNLRISDITKEEDIKTLNEFQKINHFPHALQLIRKDLFSSNMERMKRKFPSDYNIAPKSYVLSNVHDYAEFLQERMRNNSNLWMQRSLNA